LLSSSIPVLSASSTVLPYCAVHVLPLLFLLINRFVARPRMLALLKENLRNELFRELSKATLEGPSLIKRDGA